MKPIDVLKKSGKSEFFNLFLKGSTVFAGLALLFLVFLIILSGLEVMLGASNHAVDDSMWALFGWSALEDLKFFLSWLLPAYLLFTILFLISSKLAKAVYAILLTILLMIQLALIFYFNTTLLMLGSDIFGYSLDEITQTVGASGSLSLTNIVSFVALMIIVFLSFWHLPKMVKSGFRISFLLPATAFAFLLFGLNDKVNVTELTSDFETNLVKNKSQHFYKSAYEHFNPTTYEVDIYAESYLGEYFSKYANAQPLEYIDEGNYPFLHKDLREDVLSPFFNTSEKEPNIVVIMVEGLGRAFTNRGAYLGNFTPFLDSLSTKSLYWPNFLSDGGRTFAVLPSLFGSLPFGETGFMEMESRMPSQISLFNLLKKNDYQTSFYYGGNSEFDKMGVYLRKNRVDKVNDENDFPSGYKKIPKSASGFTWGYGDKELFRYYLQSTSEKSSKAPRLDVLLTISTHSPFLIDETEKYNRIFEEKMKRFGFSEEKKEDYRNYRKQYTSILFTDDALKDLIRSYKRRDDFENTIFIITGDHRIPEIPMASKIDRYHVPLIIYSPMINRPAEFEAISSHFDVAPSLVSFLKNNYNIKAPSVNAFVGRGLDTTRNFQNIHRIPLKQTKTDLIDFVMGEYHLNGNDLYKITREFKEEVVQDERKKEELLSAFNSFKGKNTQMIEGKKIWPDSITKKYAN